MKTEEYLVDSYEIEGFLITNGLRNHDANKIVGLYLKTKYPKIKDVIVYNFTKNNLSSIMRVTVEVEYFKDIPEDEKALEYFISNLNTL